MTESRPVGLPERTRVRRTHAERTAETRARIIEAVVESVADVGFARTTATEIARRAGVTWGAVQHHFGGKDGILLAVLEDSFGRFERRLDFPVEGTPLEARVQLFVDRAWEHFSSRQYRCTFEIMLNHPGRGDREGPAKWPLQMSRAWDRVWRRLFAEAALPRRRHRTLQHYTVGVLSGLASTLLLEGGEARLSSAELDLLKDTLVRELCRRG